MLSNVSAKVPFDVRSNHTDKDHYAQLGSVLTQPANIPQAIPLSVAMVKRA